MLTLQVRIGIIDTAHPQDTSKDLSTLKQKKILLFV